jgi:Na+-transporting NADH:ubiquinone oxidoreductase subunit C
MAINKDSNGYTFGFAFIMVVVVGAGLALLSTSLKPLQQKNDEVKKKLDILSAMMDVDSLNIDRSNAEVEFDKYVDTANAIIIDVNGKVVEGMFDVDGTVIKGNAFDVDIKKEFKNKKRDEKYRNYPLFLAIDGQDTSYVIPIVGKGLWGPIWGNICLASDMNTIKGASFGHQGETPGLGAEINKQFFINRWKGEQISNEEGFAKFEIVKDGSGPGPNSKVDGITGGTITSKGVEEMANRCLQVYVAYFKNLNK